MSYDKSNPFALGEFFEGQFKSTFEQRNASYNEPSEEKFTNSAFESFFGNIEAPTPQIKRVCGIECPKS